MYSSLMRSLLYYMNDVNKIAKHKIDFGCFAVIVIFSLIYFVNSFVYANFGFPNAYAWKDLMIKWTDGEFVRRGLLGYIFYLCDSAIPIKYFATLLFYVFFIVPIIITYKKLSFLKLPLWLFICVIFSPSLFQFNLHETLVFRKDIVIIFGLSISLLLLENIFSNKEISIWHRIILISLTYVAIYIIFLLVFEIFFFFIPLILLYILVNISRYLDLKISLVYVAFLGIISLVLFFVLVISNIGDVSTVKTIVMDWSAIYPNLVIYTDALYDYGGRLDPFVFMMMSKDRYLEYFAYIWNNTKFYQLILIYVLQFIPLIFIFRFAKIKDEYSKFNYLKTLALIAINFPLLISAVAFDFGRWIVFVLYLSVFYICFFMRETNENFNRSFYHNKWFRFIIPILSTVYILLWVPYHWSPDGTIIEFNWYLVNEFLKIFQFFFVYDFV